MTEKEVQKKIINKLKFLKITNDIIWFSRLNSGSIKTGYKNFVKLCEPGTPDILALINNKNGTISALFLEVKRLSKKIKTVEDLPIEQREFFKSMRGKPRILCAWINDPKQLGGLIKKAQEL